MKFNIDLDNNENVKLFADDMEVGYIEGFLEFTKELTESKIDEDVDDIIAYSLVKKESMTFLITPDGCGEANIYRITNDETVKSIKESLEDFEE